MDILGQKLLNSECEGEVTSVVAGKNLKGSAILALKWENSVAFPKLLLVLEYVQNVSDTMLLYPFGS